MRRAQLGPEREEGMAAAGLVELQGWMIGLGVVGRERPCGCGSEAGKVTVSLTTRMGRGLRPHSGGGLAWGTLYRVCSQAT